MTAANDTNESAEVDKYCYINDEVGSDEQSSDGSSIRPFIHSRHSDVPTYRISMSRPTLPHSHIEHRQGICEPNCLEETGKNRDQEGWGCFREISEKLESQQSAEEEQRKQRLEALEQAKTNHLEGDRSLPKGYQGYNWL